MRRCLAALLFIWLAMATDECLAYTEIKLRLEIHEQMNEGIWSVIASDWRRYDESDSEVTEICNKSSIFYRQLTIDCEPLACTTNVTVNRDPTTWDVVSTHKTIYETYNTGWILVESGKVDDNWYKVFSITNGQFSYDSLQYYNDTPSVLTSRRIGVSIVTIIKSSGMPENPQWLTGVDDGPDSKVSTDTDFPVTYGWLRRYFPNDHHSQLTACADSQAPNGMKYWEAAMLMLDPADPDDGLRVGISLVDGKPKASALLDTDRYKDYGYELKYGCKKSLADKQWHITADPEEMADYNFFKGVLLKE